MNQEFKVRLASKPEEFNDAYKLRYEIFVNELGYQIPNISPETGVQEEDDKSCYLIVGYDGEKPAGTLAFDCWKDISFPNYMIDHYHLDEFANAFPKDSIAIIRKALIAKPYRGSSLFPEMVTFLYKLANQIGVLFAFTDCSPYLVNFYEKIGFRRYAPHFYYDETKILAVPLVFIVRDLEHLRKVGSPLFKLSQIMAVTDHPSSRLYIESHWTIPVLKFGEPETFSLPEIPTEPVAPLSINQTPTFKNIPESDISEISERCVNRKFNSRDTIISENDTSTDLYLLTEGYAEVTQKKGDHYVALATLGPGDLFGEINLFTRSHRSANVVALTNCKVLQIPERLLLDLQSTKPSVACQLYKNLAAILAERVKLTSHWVAKSPPL